MPRGFGGSPRQNRRFAIGRGVTEPRFRARDQPRGHLASELPGEFADAVIARFGPRQLERARRLFAGTGKIEKARQERPVGDFAGRHDLRDAEEDDRRIVTGGRIDVRQGAVRRPQVDADDVARLGQVPGSSAPHRWSRVIVRFADGFDLHRARWFIRLDGNGPGVMR